jgi:hypothetical protein
MSAKVFISYRRDDSAGHAGRVHDRLERELGRDLLFMDVDAILLGANFVKVLGEEVAKCDVLLAIIGPGWLDARDEDGHRRLDNPHDYVRIEIAAALKRDIRVIPILLEGTPVPRAERLPEDLKDLALRNGLNVRHGSFHSDSGSFETWGVENLSNRDGGGRFPNSLRVLDNSLRLNDTASRAVFASTPGSFTGRRRGGSCPATARWSGSRIRTAAPRWW